MPQYVVYRHGGSEAGSLWSTKAPKEITPVLRVEADGPEEACRLAAQSVALQAGQYLSAEPASEVDAHEAILNLKAEALERGPGAP